MERTKERLSFRKKFIGDRKFYMMVLAVAVPIMIQNGITNFVSLLDNIMIGRIGTEQMSGASIVNQLIFVYNLCIFGGVSGAGIFTAQYFGQKDHEGVRQTFRYKFWMAVILTIGTILMFLTVGENLISMYLQGEGTAQQIADTLNYGKQYLDIMLLGLPPFMMVQIYSSTLRECGETVSSNESRSCGNLCESVCLIYLLIYGVFFFPETGCERCGNRNCAVTLCGGCNCNRLDTQAYGEECICKGAVQHA